MKLSTKQLGNLRRFQKSVDIVEKGIVKIHRSGKAQVISQNTGKKYKVDFINFSCTCIDFSIRRHKYPELKCKHILAALIKSGKLEVPLI